jgi:heptosyltransferase III
MARPDLAAPMPATRPPERVLFVTSTRIGDAVLSTGLLAHLLDTHPQARFTIACGPLPAPLFSAMPRRDRTIEIVKRPYDLHWPALWRQVATTRWSLVVDLRGSALSLLIPARRRAILRGGRRPGHKLDQLAAVLNLPETPLPTTWTTHEQRARAEALLPGPNWLILGPTANWSGKVWPAAAFAECARALQAFHPELRLAILAGPGPAERALAAPLLAALGPETLDLTGRLSIADAAAALGRARLFIGNDSGLMHLAAAAGAPTIALFGPTLAREYAPRHPHTATVVAPGPEGHASMTDLPIARVVEAALGVLQ